MVTEVGHLIDANIVDYITYINELTFSECNHTKKLLEMELHRTGLSRQKLLGQMEQGIDKIKDYITTFVVEQKILDRLEIAESVRRAKGIEPAIFTTDQVH